MPNFEYTTQELSGTGGVKAMLVKLGGSIDPSTFDDFNDMFQELLGGETLNIVIDFQDLKYINSTGMGLMVQIADSFTEGGGKVILTRIPPKVMLVMEMLGLQEFFQIVADENAALAAFAGEKPEEASVQMHIKGAKTKRQTRTITKAETSTKSNVQQQVICGHCGANLTVAGEGYFRCPRCRSLVEVEGNEVKKTYPEESDTTAELILPTSPEFIEGLCLFVTKAAIVAGMPDDSLVPLSQAVEGCCNYMIKNALDSSTGERLQAMVNAENGAFLVRLYTAGNNLKLEGRELAAVDALAKIAGKLDIFEYTSAQGGNLFTLGLKQA